MTQTKLNEAAKAERRAYFKAWRAKNKDKVKEHNQRYWQKRAAAKIKEESENNDGN